MYNNVLYTSLMILLICCSSCNNGNTASKQSKPTIEFTTDTLSIDNVSNKKLSIFVQDEIVMSFDRNQENSISMPLLDVVRKCKDKNETALCALKTIKHCKLKSLLKMN